MTSVVDLYTIQIIRGEDADTARPPTLTNTMAEIEENLTDLLPAGYSAQIRKWDDTTDEERTNPDE